MTSELPNVLVCSGLDPSGGAGFIADVRTVAALWARPVGVVTSLTVQSTLGVQQAHPVDPEVVGAQLVALLGDIEVKSVKIGLVGAVAVARELASGLALTAAPVVWDPVGAPSRGRASFDAPMFAQILELLGPHLRLITPNALELAAFAGRAISTLADAEGAARELARRAGVAVLVKGGHLDQARAVDILVENDAARRLEGDRLGGGEDVHGTGCALSAAIAAHLARGAELLDACERAKIWVAARLAAPVRPGRGAAAVV